jgi:hypothetical protein
MADPTQTVTGLEILDTAVKIGLGALITGIATYVITALNHDKDLEKQSIRRRRELLEQVSSQVERFWNSYRRYYLVSLEAIHRAKGNEDVPGVLRDDYEAKKKEVMEATDSLSSAQSSLLLLGLEGVNEKLMDFAQNSEQYMRSTKTLETEKQINELQTLHNTILDNKNEFFSKLSKSYKENDF